MIHKVFSKGKKNGVPQIIYSRKAQMENLSLLNEVSEKETD